TPKTIHILSDTSPLYSESDNFLHFDTLKPFVNHLNFDLDTL
ncbi:unnamed protein product, partial [Rotaria sp. Silwood1]